jgi:hypothetical protein
MGSGRRFTAKGLIRQQDYLVLYYNVGYVFVRTLKLHRTRSELYKMQIKIF